MVYIPKTLMIGRCGVCGRRIHAYDDYYRCLSHRIMLCEICARKYQYKCPVGLEPLEKV